MKKTAQTRWKKAKKRVATSVKWLKKQIKAIGDGLKRP